MTLDFGNRSSPNKRFVVRFAIVGTLVPLFLMLVGFFVGTSSHWEPNGLFGTVLWVLMWIIWPTWIFMIDAEHLAQIVVMLVVAASLNGLYYGTLGFLIWHVRHGRKSQSNAPASDSPA